MGKGEGKEREEGREEERGSNVVSPVPSLPPSPSQTLASPSPAGMLRVGHHILPDSALRVLRRVLQPCPQVSCGSFRLQIAPPSLPGREEKVFPPL